MLRTPPLNVAAPEVPVVVKLTNVGADPATTLVTCPCASVTTELG